MPGMGVGVVGMGVEGSGARVDGRSALCGMGAMVAPVGVVVAGKVQDVARDGRHADGHEPRMEEERAWAVEGDLGESGASQPGALCEPRGMGVGRELGVVAVVVGEQDGSDDGTRPAYCVV